MGTLPRVLRRVAPRAQASPGRVLDAQSRRHWPYFAGFGSALQKPSINRNPEKRTHETHTARTTLAPLNPANIKINRQS